MRSSTIDKEIRAEREELKKARKSNKRARGAIKEKYSFGSKVKIFFTHIFRLGILGIICVLILLYGPYAGFRDWLVTSAMTTMTHQYFATWFYNDDTINSVLDSNKVVEIDETTDTSLIQTNSNTETTTYESEYERQILERDPENNDYKIIAINEKSYSGYLVAVYDPSRIQAVVTANLGTSGQYLTTMAANNDALIAINGGGFNDPNFNSTGGSPLGITVVNGKYVTTDTYTGTGGLIGFTEDNTLVLGKMNLTEAKKLGIRDAVTFGPFLIVNGKSSEVLGNGGWGTAPRTAIGQRKDGIVLFLVVDGRTASKPGADMDDLIEIMERYGAYNAANLDGGTSSVLVVNNTIVNDPIDSTGAHKTRPISTGFIVTKDDSDDSDHSIVENKLK
jgi:exopolysaccharide biosynthesis protein